MAEYKKCFKCGEILPLSCFYRHPETADGHLNKCKECTKLDVRIQHRKNMKNEDYVEKERFRGREKLKRLGCKKSKKEIEKEREYSGLRSAKRYWAKRIDIPSGYELHHWNYNYILDVIVMPRILHRRLHSEISLNVNEGIYYYYGMPLDTIEKHLCILESIARENEYKTMPFKYLKADKAQ